MKNDLITPYPLSCGRSFDLPQLSKQVIQFVRLSSAHKAKGSLFGDPLSCLFNNTTESSTVKNILVVDSLKGEIGLIKWRKL